MSGKTLENCIHKDRRRNVGCVHYIVVTILAKKYFPLYKSCYKYYLVYGVLVSVPFYARDARGIGHADGLDWATNSVGAR